MPSLDLITTTAGRAAILGAVAGSGTLVVADVQFSSVDQAVGIATTALTSVVATRPAVGTVRAAGAGHALHVVIVDDTAASYEVRALALRLSGGTFLMVYSQAGIIASKASGSSLHLAIDLTIDAATAATITFGDTDYLLPAASEAAPGLVEMATSAEAVAGTDAVRAVTPAGIAARLAALFSSAVTWTGLHKFTNANSVEYATAQSVTESAHLPTIAQEDGTVTWRGAGTAMPSMRAIGNARYMLIPIDVPDGATITQVRVRCTPGAARATSGNRVFIALCDMTETQTFANIIAAGARDDGTTAPQTVTESLSVVVSKSTKRYFVAVVSGSDAATNNDVVHGCFVVYSVLRPLKR